MQDLQEQKVCIAGEMVLIVSWCDSKQHIWWAFAPQYLTDLWGTKKNSRLDVVKDLVSFLFEYIELVESGENNSPLQRNGRECDAVDPDSWTTC